MILGIVKIEYSQNTKSILIFNAILEIGDGFMANKRTRVISTEEVHLIINTIRTGFILPSGKKVKPNDKIASCLFIEYALGMRLSDNVRLKLSDIQYQDGKYRINYFKEKKTGKERHNVVPNEVYIYLQEYAIRNGIKYHQRLFDLTPRAVQNHLQVTCEYLNLPDDIGSHSFRKRYAQDIYDFEGLHDINMVSEALGHSSIAISQRYLGVNSPKLEQALQSRVVLPT